MSTKKPLSALLVSGAAVPKLTEIISPVFSPITTSESAADARRVLSRGDIDVVIINTPLPDEFGKSLAIYTAESTVSSVLLLVRGEDYEKITAQVEDHGIFTLRKPCSPHAVFQAAKLMVAAMAKIGELQKKNEELRFKIEDMAMCSRAKLLLVQHLQMTEAEAHRYIEKQSMDLCQKRRTVAENIIRTYED